MRCEEGTGLRVIHKRSEERRIVGLPVTFNLCSKGSVCVEHVLQIARNRWVWNYQETSELCIYQQTSGSVCKGWGLWDYKVRDSGTAAQGEGRLLPGRESEGRQKLLHQTKSILSALFKPTIYVKGGHCGHSFRPPTQKVSGQNDAVWLTPVAYPRIFFGGGVNKFSWGQRERGSGGGSPLVRGSGGSCNLVKEISFHIVNFSPFLVL